LGLPDESVKAELFRGRGFEGVKKTCDNRSTVKVIRPRQESPEE